MAKHKSQFLFKKRVVGRNFPIKTRMFGIKIKLKKIFKSFVTNTRPDKK